MTYGYLTPTFWFPLTKLLHTETSSSGSEPRIACGTGRFDVEKQLYQLTVELPGLPKDALEDFAQENELTVRTKSDSEKHIPQFYRRVSFNTKIDLSTIKASYSNGLLDIEIRPEVPAKISVKID